jgi:hypothetical protein
MADSVDLWNSCVIQLTIRIEGQRLSRPAIYSKLVFRGDVPNGEKQVSLWDLPDAK